MYWSTDRLRILPNVYRDDNPSKYLQKNIHSCIYHIDLSIRQGYDKFTKRKQAAHDMPETKNFGKCPMDSPPFDQKSQFCLE